MDSAGYIFIKEASPGVIQTNHTPKLNQLINSKPSTNNNLKKNQLIKDL
jgi:hypothetical protein